MPLEFINGDITKLNVDAIVNAANNTLLGGGGVDGAIHNAAGPELLKECMTLGGCDTGDAKITKGYNLPAKYVIHTVGPVYSGGNNNEAEKLKSCYERSLKIAKEYNLESIAFPMISCGVYGYPIKEANKIAIDTISKFLYDNDMLVYIVIFDKRNIRLGDDIPQLNISAQANLCDECDAKEMLTYELNECCIADYESGPFRFKIDESAKEMVMRIIIDNDLIDKDVYTKSNIDRKTFSKFKNNKDYKPSKNMFLALSVGLELSIEDTEELLEKAGYALSYSFLSDLIVRHYIEEEIYDINRINATLFDHDQKLLGSSMN